MNKKSHMVVYFSGMQIPLSTHERTLLCAEKGAGKSFRLKHWASALHEQGFPYVFIKTIPDDQNSISEIPLNTPLGFSTPSFQIFSNVMFDRSFFDESAINSLIAKAMENNCHILFDGLNKKLSSAINQLLEIDYRNCTVAVRSIYDCDKMIGVSFNEELFDRIFIGKTTEAIIGPLLNIEPLFLFDIKQKTFLQRK